jgi:N6-adenosine-specific RNA methylase IME4
MIGWPEGKFAAIYADPPWLFQSWAPEVAGRKVPYATMSLEQIKALPVPSIAAEDCVLFMWICWPHLTHAMATITAWGFEYKTCAFSWIKADASQMELFRDDIDPFMGMGYWSRGNSEVCLLATRGNPKRQDAGVRQAIIEPRREHSRKPDCVYERIERLVDGPYVELFARNEPRPGWTKWGNDVGKFKDHAKGDSGEPVLFSDMVGPVA